MTTPQAEHLPRQSRNTARSIGVALVAVSVIGLTVLGFVLALVLAPTLSPAGQVMVVAAPAEPPPGGEVATTPSAIGSATTERDVPVTSRVPLGRRALNPASRLTPGPDQPVLLAIPRLGLVANVGAMSVPGDSNVNPPTPGSAYWIRGYGAAGPASDNTIYIAGHTFRHGKAVFNPLLDVANSAVTVVTGDEIEVTAPSGTYRYIVADIAKYDKATIGGESKLWTRMPGRLAIITCFQYNGGTSSTQNVVVYAQLAG